jgi:two-component system OmpR family response regulator
MADVLIYGDDWARVSRASMLIHRRGFSVITAGPGLDPTEVTRNCDPDFVVEIHNGTPAHNGDGEPHDLECDRPRTVIYQRIGIIDGAVDDHADALRLLTSTIAGTLPDQDHPHRLSVDDLELDTDAHSVHVAGEPVELTATPFELLRILMEHVDQVLSKPQLLNLLYDEHEHDPNLIEAHISTIRRAIDITHPHIETVRGIGYIIRSEPRPSGSETPESDQVGTDLSEHTADHHLEIDRSTGLVSVFPMCHTTPPLLPGIPPRIRGQLLAR